MSPDELKACARRVADELLTQGDLAVADTLFAPDLAQYGRVLHASGLAAAKQYVRALRRAFPDLCASVEDEIAEGDRVAQRVILSGTHRGEYYGLPPTGRRATWQVLTILRIGHGGKVTEQWASPDLLDLLRQLGAPPTPNTAHATSAAGEGAA